MYVYKRTEPMLWTVGWEDSEGRWHSESDHDSSEEAAGRVAFLNGNSSDKAILNKLDTIIGLLGEIKSDKAQQFMVDLYKED